MGSVGGHEGTDEGPCFWPDVGVDYEEFYCLAEDGGDEVEFGFGAAVGLAYVLETSLFQQASRRARWIEKAITWDLSKVF